MDRPPAAPPVVAVIVASEPGPWFEDTLRSFGAQDYPNLSVLVVDGARTVDSARRVAAVLPEAYVRRVEGGGSFAALANDALDTVQGAAFLAFCHADAAPDPDAVRRLVEEAFRSNAAVVGPKIVDWDRPERLLDVGLIVDKTGNTAPIVERGELDQEQHDGVRDVFSVTNTFMLVRSDLFSALGGFDAVMGDNGVDVDFCWRAQVAGGRVLVAPAARVRHRLGGDEAAPPDEAHLGLDRRHHLRAMLKNYSFLHLLRVAPQAAVVTLVEWVLALAGRRWREVRDLPAAWWWNLRNSKDLRRRRRRVQNARAVPDSDVRRLQVRGSVRLTNYLRRRLHAEDRAEALVQAGQRLAVTVNRGPGQAAALLLVLVGLAVVVGGRHLIFGPIPAVGELSPFPSVSAFLRSYLPGWRITGMGSPAPNPPAFAVFGLGGIAFLGRIALLQKVLVVGVWPAAAWGVWRLTRPFGSTMARFVAMVAYLAVPVSYNAVARGRWGAMIIWAAMPWLLGLVAHISHLAPFEAAPAGHRVRADGGDGSPVPVTRARLELLKLGVLIAAVSLLAPSVGIVLLVAVGGLFIGSVLVGGRAGLGRAFVGVIAAIVVAAVLLLPWTVDLFAPGGWATVVGVAPDPARAPGLGALLRFELGPMGAAPLGWAFLVAAALPLTFGRGWRFAWAVRFWFMALACVLVAWAGGRGWIPLRLETPDALLAPAALGLSLAVALGAAAFDLDLPGYRFGWRQMASLASAGALFAGVLPLLAGVPDGRWTLTDQDVAGSLEWMDAEAANGAFRVLWVGDPVALPLDAWPYEQGVGYATSRDGMPSAVDLLPGSTSGATRAIAGSLREAARGDTARLGRLLAPMGVRYIVVPTELGTGSTVGGTYPVPASITRALVSQIDLRLLPSDPGVAVYENTSWGPGRAFLPDRLAGPLPQQLGPGADLAGGAAVLPGTGPVKYSGPVPGGGTVLVSEAPSARWQLQVSGAAASRQTAYGVANAYRTGSAGNGVLRYRTPLLRYVLILVGLGLWLLAGRYLVRLRRRAHDVETMAHPQPPQRERDLARS